MPTTYGVVVEGGFGVTKDQAEAKKLYERACGANVAVACHHLAVELSKGSAADQSRARTFHEKGCERPPGRTHDDAHPLGSASSPQDRARWCAPTPSRPASCARGSREAGFPADA